jgi:hypothetical protein
MPQISTQEFERLPLRIHDKLVLLQALRESPQREIGFSTSASGRLHAIAIANPEPASNLSTLTTSPSPCSRTCRLDRGTSTFIVKLTRVFGGI